MKSELSALFNDIEPVSLSFGNRYMQTVLASFACFVSSYCCVQRWQTNALKSRTGFSFEMLFSVDVAQRRENNLSYGRDEMNKFGGEQDAQPTAEDKMKRAFKNGGSAVLGAMKRCKDVPPFIIGVAGGSASGKTSVCSRIMEDLEKLNYHRQQVTSLSQDSFYRELIDEEERHKADKGNFNFDHPDAFETQLLVKTLKELQRGKPVVIPKYDFRTNARIPGEYLEVLPADVILVEGILIFCEAELRCLFDMKLFVDTDPDIRLARRVTRDMEDRGRSLDKVLHQYLKLVKPAYEEFCMPTKKFADVIIPRGAENEVAIDLIVQHIQEYLSRRDSGMSSSDGEHRHHLPENGPEPRHLGRIRPH